MPIFIAMLRGINVGGQKSVKMELLRASFTALGFNDVKTYVQSGNVIFGATDDSATALSKKIERKILGDFRFHVPVFLRTAEEMETTVRRNPFLKDAAIDPSKLHVTFLASAPPKAAHKKLQPLAVCEEQFHITGRDVYLHCPNGYGTTKLSNTAIEKKLSIGATTRSWKTANTLLAMAQ